MEAGIVRSAKPITLIGGGFLGKNDLSDALQRAPTLVAADGGAAVALAGGHVPRAVFGDFDSLSPRDRARIPPDRLHRIPEQDSTDFDKALRHVAAPLVLAVGFLGARIDHQMAALNVLVRRAAQPCLLLGAHEVIFHLPPRLAVPVEPGDVVSLFPMAPVTGRSEGLEWPIDGLALAPDGRVGTSNRALSSRITLETDGPGLLCLLPRARLDGIMQAFLATSAAGR